MLERVSREADEKGCHEVVDVIAEVDAKLRARASTKGAAHLNAN